MTLAVTNFAVDVTLAGIVIVFSMLILLVAIISIFGKLMSGAKKEKKVNVEAAPTPKKVVNKPSTVVNTSKTISNDDDDELIAVITAAVYSMYEGTGVKPVIKAVRPSVGVNQWKFAGVQQNMKSFF